MSDAPAPVYGSSRSAPSATVLVESVDAPFDVAMTIGSTRRECHAKVAPETPCQLEITPGSVTVDLAGPITFSKSISVPLKGGTLKISEFARGSVIVTSLVFAAIGAAATYGAMNTESTGLKVLGYGLGVPAGLFGIIGIPLGLAENAYVADFEETK